MGFMDFIERLIYNSAEDETKDKINMIEAGSMESIFNKASQMGIDLFDGTENNGYIKNNNEEIGKHLSFVNPHFDSREFIKWAQKLFKAAAKTQGWETLDGEVKPFIDKNFNFSKINMDKIFSFSVSYLHLYMRDGDNEVLQVYIAVMDKAGMSDTEARRFFLRFKRPSQFKIVEMRRVKTTACPNCGAPVFFKRGNMEKCGYCGQYVTFEEYGWLLCEAEEITPQTEINNIGIM